MSEPRRDTAEVDLGRWTARVAARWWIVALVVVAAIVVAFLQGSRSKNYEAKSLVFLGQPFAGGSPVTVAPSSNPTFAKTIITQPAIVRTAERRAKLPKGALNGHISTSAVSGSLVGKATYTPYVNIAVTGPWKDNSAVAANWLSRRVIDEANAFVDAKVARLSRGTARLNRERGRLEGLEQRFDTDLEQLRKSANVTTTQLLLVQPTIFAALNNIQIRLNTIDDRNDNNQLALAQANKLEASRLVSPAIAEKASPGTPVARYTIAVLFGLVAGTLLALLSYVVWPAAGTKRLPTFTVWDDRA